MHKIFIHSQLTFKKSRFDLAIIKNDAYIQGSSKRSTPSKRSTVE
jgi:hypothetical protein